MKILYLLILGLVSSWFMSCQSAEQTTGTSTESYTFTILQLNDVYEIAPLENGKVGGMARVATLLKELEQENPNTIAILAGDFLSPSLMGTLKDSTGERINGQQMVEVMNAVGIDYVTFGNHEFDLSNAEVVQKRINESKFRYISANVLHKQPGNKQPFQQPWQGQISDIPPYDIIALPQQNQQTLNVGLIGVTLPFNRKPYVSYLDHDSAMVAYYEQIKDSCDVVIGITHLEMIMDSVLATKVQGMPLLIGGHDHNHMEYQIGKTLVTKADANAKTAYVHRLTVDPQTQETTIESELVYINDQIIADSAVQALVGKWQALSDTLLKQMGYTPDEELTTLQDSLEARESIIRTLPTNYGQLTAQAMLDVVPGYDAAFLNSGSFRLDDLLKGIVTQYDVLRTFPFGGPVVVTELSGAVLAQVLDSGLVKNKGIGGYLQTAQISWENNQWHIGGQLLNSNESYKVVLPEFLMKGNEKRLEFLANYRYEVPESFKDGKVDNDIRALVIAFFKKHPDGAFSQNN